MKVCTSISLLLGLCARALGQTTTSDTTTTTSTTTTGILDPATTTSTTTTTTGIFDPATTTTTTTTTTTGILDPATTTTTTTTTTTGILDPATTTTTDPGWSSSWYHPTRTHWHSHPHSYPHSHPIHHPTPSHPIHIPPKVSIPVIPSTAIHTMVQARDVHASGLINPPMAHHHTSGPPGPPGPPENVPKSSASISGPAVGGVLVTAFALFSASM
ncbi:hypothetical protein GGR55DRAFT_606466 [Xylaria sp. FL0064]|nr:hypothetical protein GGR55DRAFT_606466 [Xylaria sp. FL0064]